ncbi:MAG: FAD-dependent oxidoreductase [Candidatus Daviesbacteria bacterium]|nr:FAD-dependent oxidoreductase [Candidatus Daviesbacteria bacterium]
MLGKIIERREITHGTLQVVFKLSQPVNFKPGQYFFVNLPMGRKQFSINNSPNQSNILTLTTRLTGSDFKNALNELPIGAEVELGPIAGIFTLPEDQTKPLVFIAGGIGITPFMSMLRYLRETENPYKITLVYSNRNQASTAFLNEVSDFKFIKLILTMTDDPNWIGEKRRIDAGFIKEYFPNINENLYMVVGPPAMVEAVRKALEEAGVSKENIKFENFTGY